MAINSTATLPTWSNLGGDSPLGQDIALRGEIRILDAQTKAAQTSIKSINGRIKKLLKKKDKDSLREVARLRLQAQTYQARLRGYVASRSTKQNSLWEMRGEYDKLLSGEGRNAYLALKTLFSDFGLESLAGKIYDYVKNGYQSDTISILLQDTPEYKRRFAANEIRQKAGLSVLSPAEYIDTENSYRQIMRQSGLPEGFYDSNEDFTSFISGDMSPTELKSRVDLATQATALANPTYKQALKQMGIGDGDIAAYFLDQKKGLPFIQKAAATAAIGAEAIQRGFAFDQQYAENLATQGVTREQAAQAYANIGDEFSDLKTLGQIYGGGWTQRQAEESAFIGGTAASEQRKSLISQEKGAFSGATGGARSGFAQKGGAR